MERNRVDAVAREIRKYYLERKQVLFKQKFKLSEKHSDFFHWQRAAEVCIELNATPEVYVDAAFSYCQMPTGPYPNAMYGVAARKWYAAYNNGRTDLLQSRQKSEEAGRDFMFDEENDVSVLNLKADIEYVNRSLLRLLGSSAITDSAIEYLASIMASYPPHVRVLLAPGNEKVKKFFGKYALEYYMKNPRAHRAAEILGYPIRDILLWLNVQTH
jgi:hypothetical protein